MATFDFSDNLVGTLLNVQGDGPSIIIRQGFDDLESEYNLIIIVPGSKGKTLTITVSVNGHVNISTGVE